MENQIDATEALVRLAYDSGALAASAFGAGFGGSIWALAREHEANEIASRWSAAYCAAFPQHAEACEFFGTPPSHATLSVEL